MWQSGNVALLHSLPSRQKQSFQWVESVLPMGGSNLSNGRKQSFQWAETFFPMDGSIISRLQKEKFKNVDKSMDIFLYLCRKE